MRQFAPVDGRHWLDDGRGEDAADSVDWVVVDVAGTHGQVHDFACAHQDALEGRLMPGTLDAFDRLDDERGCDLIDLTTAKWSDDVSLHAPALILVRHDPPALEVFPERPSVAQYVAAWRLLTELFALAPSDLPGLHETHLWPMSKREVCDATTV